MTTAYRKTSPAASVGHHTADERHVMDYVRTVYRRRWIAIPVFLLVIVAGSLNAVRETPVYRARTQLMIDKDTPTVTNHHRDLYDAGCIEIVDYEVNGNVRKPLYRAVTLPYVSDEIYRAMSLLERHDANGVILQWFLAACFSSYRNEKMDRDENVCLIWNDPTLDAQGRIEMRDWLICPFPLSITYFPTKKRRNCRWNQKVPRSPAQIRWKSRPARRISSPAPRMGKNSASRRRDR